MQLDILGKLIDDFCVAKEARLHADKHAASLKAVEVELKNRVMQEMLNNDCHMVGGTYKKVTLKTKQRPQVADWSEVYKFIVDTGATDLLQRRLSEAAVKARVDDGVAVPGVEYIETNDLSVSKL